MQKPLSEIWANLTGYQIIMQNNWAVLITKYKSLSVSAFSFISVGCLFIDVKLRRPKICITCCIRDRHEKSIQN